MHPHQEHFVPPRLQPKQPGGYAFPNYANAPNLGPRHTVPFQDISNSFASGSRRRALATPALPPPAPPPSIPPPPPPQNVSVHLAPPPPKLQVRTAENDPPPESLAFKVELSNGQLVDFDQWKRIRSFLAVWPNAKFPLYQALAGRPIALSEEVAAEFRKWERQCFKQEETYRYMEKVGQKLRPYILSPLELALNDFILPTYLRRYAMDPQTKMLHTGGLFSGDGWFETKEGYKKLLVPPKVFAIDCEMVLCGEEPVLAQICVVDYVTERTVYSHYVVPPVGKVVTDCLTHVSGVTPQMLQTATMTLEAVQRDLANIIEDSNTILIGHGLHSDLRALKLAHPRVIDTSLIFDPPYGKRSFQTTMWQRPKLQDLVHVHLGQRDFQIGSHSPAEDAKACIHLVKLKSQKNTKFGGIGFRQFRDEQLELLGLPAASKHEGSAKGDHRRMRLQAWTDAIFAFEQGFWRPMEWIQRPAPEAVAVAPAHVAFSARPELPRRRSHAIEIRAPPPVASSSSASSSSTGHALPADDGEGHSDAESLSSHRSDATAPDEYDPLNSIVLSIMKFLDEDEDHYEALYNDDDDLTTPRPTTPPPSLPLTKPPPSCISPPLPSACTLRSRM